MIMMVKYICTIVRYSSARGTQPRSIAEAGEAAAAASPFLPALNHRYSRCRRLRNLGRDVKAWRA